MKCKGSSQLYHHKAKRSQILGAEYTENKLILSNYKAVFIRIGIITVQIAFFHMLFPRKKNVKNVSAPFCGYAVIATEGFNGMHNLYTTE